MGKEHEIMGTTKGRKEKEHARQTYDTASIDKFASTPIRHHAGEMAVCESVCMSNLGSLARFS